jgi:hypothetical protein
MALIGEQCASHIFAGTGSEKTLQQSQLDDAQQPRELQGMDDTLL